MKGLEPISPDYVSGILPIKLPTNKWLAETQNCCKYLSMLIIVPIVS